MARTLACAWPSSCIRFSSDTPPSVHRSVGNRTSASVLPSRSKARHLTAPVLKSQPVRMLLEAMPFRGSATMMNPHAMDGASTVAAQQHSVRAALLQSAWRLDGFGGACWHPCVPLKLPRSELLEEQN